MKRRAAYLFGRFDEFGVGVGVKSYALGVVKVESATDLPERRQQAELTASCAEVKS